MRKLAKLMSVLLIVPTTMGVLAGCSNEPKKETVAKVTQSATPIATPAATTTAPSLPVIGTNLKYDPNVAVNGGNDITLKLWIVEDWAAIYEKWTAEYSTIHPNVKFDINKSGWGDYWNKLPVAIQNGTGPDLYHMHNAKTDIMLNNMAPLPTDVFPVEQLKADFRQVDSHLIDGQLYYIDLGLSTGGIFYNKDMWQEAGLTEANLPKTWDELLATAKKLTKTESGKNTQNGFDLSGNAGWFLLGLNGQKGLFNFKADGINTDMSNPAVIENATFIKDIAFKHKLYDPQGAPSQESFGNKRSAMMYNWPWVGNYLNQNFPDVKWGFFKLPTFDGQVPPSYDRNNGETSFCVNPNASEEAKAVGFDFLKYFLANDEALLQVATTIYCAPSKYSLDTLPEITGNEVIKTQLDMIDNTIWPGALSTTFETNMGSIISDGIMLLNMDPKEALTKFDQEMAKAAGDAKVKTVERQYKNAEQFKNK